MKIRMSSPDITDAEKAARLAPALRRQGRAPDSHTSLNYRLDEVSATLGTVQTSRLAVPFSGVMTEEQVEYVCDAIRDEIK